MLLGEKRSGVNVTVVMPTLGRSTLRRAVSSVVDQLEDDDELIVVGDAAVDHRAWDVVAGFQPARVLYVEARRPGSVFGNAQRDFGMELAAGRTSHLMFLDDDDVWEHGALDKVRWAVGDSLQHAHLFRCMWGPGHHAHGTVLWADPQVREGNVGTPMVVLPNRAYERSWWDFNRRGVVSDFGFLSAAIGECAGEVFHEPVIATVRP